MEKISLQMYTLRDFTKTPEDLDATLEKLAKIGFDTIQYSIPRGMEAKEVKRLLDKHNIVTDSLFCSCNLLESDAVRVIGECDMFGTDYIRLESIPVEFRTRGKEGYIDYAHFLNNASKEYKKHGKKILYHFHAFEFIRFGEITGLDLFLQETDPEVIQIIPDTHWIQSGGKDPAKFLREYADRYDYVHTKDFTLGPCGERLESRPIRFAPVGDGNLDWPEIIKACKANNVTSYAIEQDELYGADAFECVERSFNFLKKMGVDAE